MTRKQSEGRIALIGKFLSTIGYFVSEIIIHLHTDLKFHSFKKKKKKNPTFIVHILGSLFRYTGVDPACTSRSDQTKFKSSLYFHGLNFLITPVILQAFCQYDGQNVSGHRLFNLGRSGPFFKYRKQE